MPLGRRLTGPVIRSDASPLSFTPLLLFQVVWVEQRKFFIFETVMMLLGGVSYGVVFLRQKQQVRGYYLNML